MSILTPSTYYLKLILQCRDPLSVWPWSNDSTVDPSLNDHTEDGDVMIMDYAPYAVSHAASRERARTSTARRRYRFSRTSLSGGSIGMSRRRMGRGGRCVCVCVCVCARACVWVGVCVCV